MINNTLKGPKDFKITVAVIFFVFVILKILIQRIIPDISDIILLSVSIVVITYLWVKEALEKESLLTLDIRLKKTKKELEDLNFGTILSLFHAEEAKDIYTKGHCSRVTKYATLIAESLGLRGDDLEVVIRAGLLHDLGKIKISESILDKPDKLNQEEWKVVKNHPKDGEEMLKPLTFLDKERDIILHHHEKCDGTGYPNGLKKDEIPLGSRILAVADTFDAMNSKRAYRSALPKDVILEELKKVKDSQLDGNIVEKFLEILKRHPDLWDSENLVQ